MFALNFSPQLLCGVTPPLTVLQVYPSSNPLDQKDFNPIDYINELFPSEQVQSSCLDYKTTPTFMHVGPHLSLTQKLCEAKQCTKKCCTYRV